jgi:hypothetical protein
MTRPKTKFTVKEYITAPNDNPYQLQEGKLLVAPTPYAPP